MSSDISPPPLKRKRLDTLEISPVQSPQSEITIYSWNVNGIAPLIQRPITSFFATRDTGPANKEATGFPLRAFLRRQGWPILLFLQEVKIKPDDSATTAAVEKAVRRHPDEPRGSPNYRAHFCSPSDKHNARGFGGRVYGVCTIIREDFYDLAVDRVRPVSWDNEGRFLITETNPTTFTPKLALINVYAVNGTDNPYKDPATGTASGTRHDRKLRVHALLQQECRALEAAGFRCIIAGDLNIARAAIDGFPNLRTFPTQHCVNRADFEARFILDQDSAALESAPCLGMLDAFRYLHPSRRGYTYYPRTKRFGESCDRVDMMLISPLLEPFLEAAGMLETPADRGPSDHVPLYARLGFGESDT